MPRRSLNTVYNVMLIAEIQSHVLVKLKKVSSYQRKLFSCRLHKTVNLNSDSLFSQSRGSQSFIRHVSFFSFHLYFRSSCYPNIVFIHPCSGQERREFVKCIWNLELFLKYFLLCTLTSTKNIILFSLYEYARGIFIMKD